MHACIHPSIHPSIQWPKWVRNDQKGYEMTWVRTDHHIVISYPVQLGTKWPKWVLNDLGTKWLLLGTKWPKSRNEMTKKGTKWPGYEMTWVRNDWQPRRLRSAWTSAQFDQRGFAVCMKVTLTLSYPVSACKAKTLIRLDGCPGWSVFAEPTRHFVSFVTMCLKYCFQFCQYWLLEFAWPFTISFDTDQSYLS